MIGGVDMTLDLLTVAESLKRNDLLAAFTLPVDLWDRNVSVGNDLIRPRNSYSTWAVSRPAILCQGTLIAWYNCTPCLIADGASRSC